MEKDFCPKNWENGPKWLKIGFFEFKEKFGINFHCIYSILNIFIYCVPAQILWEKSCS